MQYSLYYQKQVSENKVYYECKLKNNKKITKKIKKRYKNKYFFLISIIVSIPGNKFPKIKITIVGICLKY